MRKFNTVNVKQESDNDNIKLYKYVCIASNQPHTKSNPNRNPNANPVTKQHALVSIQLFTGCGKKVTPKDFFPVFSAVA